VPFPVRSREDARPADGPAATLASLFAEAAAHSSILEQRYVIGGLPVRMRFAGSAMLERIGRSFEHLIAEDATDTDPGAELTINVWDSVSTSTPVPPVLGVAMQNDGTGPIYYYDIAGVRAISRWETLSAYDAFAGEAWFWAPSPARMLSWDWASPLRAILHWWLGDHGMLQVHGGAVGLDDGGVLIVGRGGSGKSTTSLASLLAGLAYAGDDFVALQPHPLPYVHSLYSSGKLESHQVARFPALAAAQSNLERLDEEKAVIYATDVEGATTTSGFLLRAILVPRIAGGVSTKLVPTSPAAALAALAPSTIFQLHPPQPGALGLMGDIVRRVPCLSFELGTDLDAIPEAIASYLRAS
jgi:hypothetical protein